MGLKTAQPYSNVPVGALRRASQLRQHSEEGEPHQLQQQQQQQQQQQHLDQRLRQQGPSPVDAEAGASPDMEALPPLPLPPSITVNRGQR